MWTVHIFTDFLMFFFFVIRCFRITPPLTTFSAIKMIQNFINIIWNEFNNTGGYNTTNLWGSLCAGSYDINSLDDNGCTADVIGFTVSAPTAILVSFIFLPLNLTSITG